MNLREEIVKYRTRRQFFKDCSTGLGTIALASLLNEKLFATPPALAGEDPLTPKKPHFPAKAKNVIYLHMAGAPPSLDLFDYKPKLNELNGKPCPESLIKGQRFAFIKGTPNMLGSPHKFKQHGQSGNWFSDLIPNIAGIADDICVVKSLYTA